MGYGGYLPAASIKRRLFRSLVVLSTYTLPLELRLRFAAWLGSKLPGWHFGSFTGYGFGSLRRFVTGP